MSKKRRRKKAWRFSQGGGALFLFLLLLPLWIQVAARLKQGRSGLSLIVSVILLIFLGAVTWFFGIQPLISEKRWRMARTWYEGFFGIGLLQLLYGTLVALTGHTLSRYGSHPIPRTAAIPYFLIALVALGLGSTALLLERRYGIGQDTTSSKKTGIQDISKKPR